MATPLLEDIGNAVQSLSHHASRMREGNRDLLNLADLLPKVRNASEQQLTGGVSREVVLQELLDWLDEAGGYIRRQVTERLVENVDAISQNADQIVEMMRSQSSETSLSSVNRRFVIIIPARYDSTRLPGKPLLDINGKPMIQHVYERAVETEAEAVLVATDDERIVRAVQAFGGKALMTARRHRSGTDRVAEAVHALSMEDDLVVVNLQGDEPMVHPEMIHQVVAPLLNDDSVVMSTLAAPMLSEQMFEDAHTVKVVCDLSGFALYFSRDPIPHGSTSETALHHVGIYAYRADFLQQFAELGPTALEQQEKLEQLRVLEHGYRIRVVRTDRHPTMAVTGVDTPEDLSRVREHLNSTNQRNDSP